jgi:hypothetical protein
MMVLRLLLVAVIVEATMAAAAAGGSVTGSTCGQLKAAYKANTCCGAPTKATNHQIVPFTSVFAGTNTCAGKKPVTYTIPGSTDKYFDDINCTTAEGVRQALEQAGANVTAGYRGQLNATGGYGGGGPVNARFPITTSYLKAGLCPVNVHWHLGAEHYSAGEYDEFGTGPAHTSIDKEASGHFSRRASKIVRLGFRCSKYSANDKKFTTPYEWKHCDKSMMVGETYEVHWPHSTAGACGTPNQYQSPFYDGVFCNVDGPTANALLGVDAKGQSTGTGPLTHKHVGVQSQVYTIVNDEAYYYPDLIRGMIVEGEYGKDMAKYTGSTTGTSRDNTVCSRYTPITWQVDRKCHLISASTFDKMCADMKQMRDDMSGDLHAHGSRTLVSDFMAANNQARRNWFPTTAEHLH